jgi:hypothetical protein
MQEGEDDEDIPTNDTSPTSTSSLPQQDTSHIPFAGPITRARAHQLNNQVSSLLSSCKPCIDCGDTCTVGLLRNHGEEQLGKGFRRLYSDCSTTPTSNGRIRSQIGVFKYFLEP